MTSFSIDERRASGKALRDQVPRAEHATWAPADDVRDPVSVIEESNVGRLRELVPLRYGRMLRNPFTFLRGSPALMAGDLAGTPVTGPVVQACGDCHLTNFGLFATPERNLIFDVNDFDETLPAPWEWDVKRLAASFVVAGRVNGIADTSCAAIAENCVRSYREHIREFATMSPLEIWYYRIDVEDLIDVAHDDASRNEREAMAEKARRRIGEHLFPKITLEVDGRHHFVEQPPIMTRVTDESRQEFVHEGVEDYRATLSEDRQAVFNRYRLEDFAQRVVGIGSVGTRCYVGLFFCDDRNALLLQVKEAGRSVLEPYAAPSRFANQGQRVVVGQRLMQAASDMFLGWLRTRRGHDYYVRQLRDMKYSVPIDRLTAEGLSQHAEICGWALARAHAKSGAAAQIGGYLGRGARFDTALASFAVAYADQTERDHAMLVKAQRAGRIAAVDEPD